MDLFRHPTDHWTDCLAFVNSLDTRQIIKIYRLLANSYLYHINSFDTGQIIVHVDCLLTSVFAISIVLIPDRSLNPDVVKSCLAKVALY